MRARSQGATVIAWDADPAVLAAVTARGLAVAASSFPALAAGCEVLVLAAPLDATLDQLGALRELPSSAMLVIDVASVKAAPARAGIGVPHFVPTHPIAGSERSGYTAARRDLFDGKVWTYAPDGPADDVARARSFIEAMGARPIAVDAAEHDRIVALTSHVPQLLSVLLGARLARRFDESDVSALCGTGIASMLRLSSSAWHVWEPILAANAASIAQEVRELSAILLDAATALETGSVANLQDAFAAAKAAVTRLEANGPALARFTPSTDAPIGDAPCNEATRLREGTNDDE